jgi:hypothetical protein
MPRATRRAYRIAVRSDAKVPQLVENSLSLSITDVIGKGSKPGVSIVTLYPARPQTGMFQFQGPIVGELDLRDLARASVRLQYEIDGVPLDYCVRLMWTEQSRQWWFVCPIEKVRVAKLFLPIGARRFASRKAHGLVYRCRAQRRPRHVSLDLARLMQRFRGKN